MADEIQVQISQASVQQIINAHVQTAVMAALRPHSEQFIRELVEKSLLHKPEGGYNQYKRDDQKVTFLEGMVRTMIAEEAQKAIKDWVESHREEIGQQIRKAISTQGFAKKYAMQMVEAMLAATASNYKFEVKLELTKPAY